MKAFATHRFEQIRQRDFARLSGDFNPLHVDPLFARRTLYGEPVVHGVHLALWALEAWLADRPRPAALGELKARFHKPVPLEIPIALERADAAENHFRLFTRDGHFEISGCLDPEPNDCQRVELPQSGAALTCRETTFSEASRGEGEIPLFLDRDLLARLFPAVAAKLPAVQIAQLLASTRLTGMVCPGRRSIFHDIEMHFESNAEPPAMKYRCRQSDPRFSIVRLAVSGSGMRGILSSFFNPAPVNQPSAVEVANAVRPDEFKGQNALVIGGSRGLGELTAKIIAAGGGSVRLTYHRGREDAARVIAELKALNADARCFPLDVLSLDRPAIQEALQAWTPSHLYYFASPKLEPSSKCLLKKGTGSEPNTGIPSENELKRRACPLFQQAPKGQSFSAELFDRYRLFYERGLQDILKLWAACGSSGIRVFYPSTFLLNGGEECWREFAAAKAEGEKKIRCFLKESGCGGLYAPRLPWLPTDRTMSLRLKVDPKALEVLLSEIRRSISFID
ncbi:MAG: SDR family NAD(P)-dependent oxidoreductase [Pirellulales bacterium]|nr:SDR family NAD(P)-dependent oxidoreductase [Pirellulales bacterium]